ncbi:MAG: hypothetical protein WAV41_02070 [Microgenomates group bacterium]
MSQETTKKRTVASLDREIEMRVKKAGVAGVVGASSCVAGPVAAPVVVAMGIEAGVQFYKTRKLIAERKRLFDEE